MSALRASADVFSGFFPDLRAIAPRERVAITFGVTPSLPNHDPMLPGPDDLARAVARLKAGGVVAFPTETVYGLGAVALSAEAVQRVFTLKGRPSNNPLIVHVSGPEMAKRVVAPGAWTDDADALARAFWPGPLSLILPKHPDVPDVVTGGGPNVAVRCPDHPATLALLYALNQPLVGPSANLSGRVSPTTAQHVRESFPNPEDVLVLDGGPSASHVGIESTVLDLSQSRPKVPRILRPGAISAGDLSMVLGKTIEDHGSPTATDAREPLPSPGLLARHYAPQSLTRLYESDFELEDFLRQSAINYKGIVLGLLEPRESLHPHATWVQMPTSARAYASVLYARLRDADALHPRCIMIQTPTREMIERDPMWHAIMDRLTRAAER